MSMPVIWIDFEDILVHLETRSRPSGIQRLAFEVARELIAIAPPGRVRFLRHARGGSGFREIAFELAEAAFATASGAGSTTGIQGPPRVLRSIVPPAEMSLPPSRMVGIWRRGASLLPAEVRLAAQRILLHQWQAFTAVPALLRAIGRSVLRRPPARRGGAVETDASPDLVRMAAGDVLFGLAASWGTEHCQRVAVARREQGVRYAVLVYDLIPLVRPEFCVPAYSARFREWVDAMLPMCDLPMAISHATRRDLEAYAARQGVVLRAPVAVVPIGTSFSAPPANPDAAPPDPVLPPGSYVLFVSTIAAHKNHTLLLRVWRRLLEEMPVGRVPTLAFAGSIGWMVDDLLMQLANSRFLDGNIVIVESPSDGALESLYRGAMFTVFPSHYEGWGLPVVESLALGTPCVAARATSLPEAGGTLARYFSPDDVGDACQVIRGLIEDPAELAAWRAQVQAEFRPIAWRETARAMLAAIDAVVAGSRPSIASRVDAADTAV